MAQVDPLIDVLTQQPASASTVSNRANIDVLSPRLECEFGTLQKIDSVQVSATLASSSFNEDGQDETSSLLPYADGSEISFSASVTLSSPSCSGISAKGTTMEPIWTIFTDSPESNCTDDDYRFVFGFINSYDDRTSELTSESDDTGDFSWLGEVSSFLVCKPDYSLQSADFKFNPLATTTANRSMVHILDPNEDRKLGNITGKDMFKGFYKTLDGQNPAELLNTIMPQDNTTRFIDQELLHDAFGKLYSETVAQLASLYLMEDGQKTFYVSAITTENRIKLRGAAFWITETIIVLLMVYCGSLAWIFRKGPTPRDPGSITGLATILARSVEFRDSLRGSGLSSLERIRGDLSSFLFKTETVEGYKDTFRIRTLPRVYAKEGQGQLSIKSGSNATKWYYPFIVWIPTRIVLVVWAVALIAALEAVYELSKRDNGFLTILSQEYVEYYWHYVPVTIFLLFGMAVATLDFEIKTFEPFHKLRRGPAPSSVTVDEHYFSLVGIHALWTAARKRQCAIIATSIALVCTPFLTILASGLYYADSAFQTTPTQLRQTDSFDLETFTDINQISSQANGVMAANLVVNDNMDLPEGTYDNFAIPTFSLPSSSAANTSSLANTTSSYITVTVPALQPVANCTPITPSHINITQNTYYDTIYELDFKFSSLPPCGDPSQLGSTNPTTSMAVDTDKDFGYWTDRSSRTYHCPEYFAIAGHFSASRRNLTSLSILHCSPYLARLPATIQLTYPTLHIRRTTTPSLALSAATNGSALEILNIGTSILRPYISASALAALGGNTTRIDGFFGTLARLGSPLASLASDPSLLATAVDALYPRIATQILNLHRNSTTTTSSSSSAAEEEEDENGGALLNATLSRPNHLRLRQSAVSTHALAALLAVMAACVLASMALLRGREVLPKCPRSVAGGASLVAGGRLADGFVEGGEEGFSMGFWREEDDGGERLRLRFGIDVGCADVVR